MNKFHVFAISTVLAAFAPPVFACSSCGCLLNTDWTSQGYRTHAGLTADLRFDFANQSELRVGRSKLDRASVDPADTDELQRSTINRTWIGSLNYAPNADWSVDVSLPYIVRTHDTQPDGPSSDLLYSSSNSIGDAKVIARYQGFAPNSPVGVLFGVKLPTGATDVEFVDGSPLDRGLQPGTGSTDLILGVYHFGAVTERVGYFAQAQIQKALTRKDEFKPGTQITVNGGLRLALNDAVDTHLQLNARRELQESGANADIPNSGSTLVYLSPGINARIADGLHAYGFLQVPLYQKVTGRQLEPKYTVSFGLSYQIR